ncbi:retron St85 family effector protein [Aureimonas phyllosphaerae]|uniref:Uncharacterized protein n=1 Tax=Aureimonas phyllosphaerae TaxID=1166078 RepID=A0A7W6BT02_9HYPH|nr:retron St85 family effector protein [Aureimonas phyllosphaerae]MBB3935780.1 hypothetical protein [Aureimonas phyllosphaerae]MBB3959788.1 hypothetical protein [Aureimonas phyllosphaerae]SFF15023.1 hypothetical protein SAMN05216566_103319 [Aureimonas phyllosphaerae]
MLAELLALYASIDKGRLRYVHPQPFIFFCGGAFRSLSHSPAPSLRDYLVRDRKLERRLGVTLVLAERANQLYRDTTYPDLISFEEDIAYISSIVLLIAESAGSLAELGAFASTDGIREALRVIMTTEHADANSFIRYGPVERLMRQNASHMAAYPWKINSKGVLVKASIIPHYSPIVGMIKSWLAARPSSILAKNSGRSEPFFIILWIIYLSLTIKTSDLKRIVPELMAGMSHSDIDNKLYCMELAGWIEFHTYGPDRYVFAKTDVDPFSYAFTAASGSRDSVRAKAEVTSALISHLRAPKHVRSEALKARQEA